MLLKQPALRFVWHHAVTTMSRPSSDMTSFRAELSKAQNIAVLTGAGISAESGVPTFRGAGGLWRKFEATQLATPTAFAANPSLVWEFYQYRRNLVLQKTPNAGHHTLAKAESVLREAGKKLTVITQNIDELHKSAGTQNLVELHGSLFETWCSKCHDVAVNRDDPICPALEGKGSPDPATSEARIPREELPQCAKCKGLLRPNVVWFGEALDPDVLSEADQVLSACDLCLVVGTSSVVYPAAMFAPDVASRGVTVAEFNIEETKATNDFGYHFSGPSGDMLPLAFQDILKQNLC